MKFALMAAALVGFGSGAWAQETARAGDPAGAPLAAAVAAEAQSRLPISMGPGGTLVAARSEGNVLVWSVEVSPAHFDEARDQPAGAAGAFREGFCSTGARMLFERGVALRVEIGDGRRAPVSFPLITDCPPQR